VIKVAVPSSSDRRKRDHDSLAPYVEEPADIYGDHIAELVKFCELKQIQYNVLG
jgi:hypothetical protein